MYVLYVRCLEQVFPLNGITARRLLNEATGMPNKQRKKCDILSNLASSVNLVYSARHERLNPSTLCCEYCQIIRFFKNSLALLRGHYFHCVLCICAGCIFVCVIYYTRSGTCQPFLLISLLLHLHDQTRCLVKMFGWEGQILQSHCLKLDGHLMHVSSVIICQPKEEAKKIRKSCSIYIDVEIGLFVLNQFMSKVFTKQLGPHCHARCVSASFSLFSVEKH